MTNRTKYLNKVMADYIISNIDETPYGIQFDDGKEKDKLQFLYDTFIAEYGWNIPRQGIYKSFTEWLQGLPSVFTVAFMNYDIIQLAIKWGSLPEKHTDAQAQKILDNWFNFVMVHSFKLFKKYKIEVQ